MYTSMAVNVLFCQFQTKSLTLPLAETKSHESGSTPCGKSSSTTLSTTVLLKYNKNIQRAFRSRVSFRVRTDLAMSTSFSSGTRRLLRFGGDRKCWRTRSRSLYSSVLVWVSATPSWEIVFRTWEASDELIDSCVAGITVSDRDSATPG